MSDHYLKVSQIIAIALFVLVTCKLTKTARLQLHVLPMWLVDSVSRRNAFVSIMEMIESERTTTTTI